MVAVPDNHTTSILKGVEERIKVERELTKVGEEVDSNHSFKATTNGGRESSLERNLLQDADADNSLDENLLQEISNSHGNLDKNMLQNIDNSHKRNLLQEADADNSLDKNLMQEINNFHEGVIKQYLL